MMRISSTRAVAFAATSLLVTLEVHAELGVNLPLPASAGAKEIYDIHMLTLGIATVLMLVVLAAVIYSVVTFRKDRGYIADQHFHTSRFGTWSWLAVPVLVLGVDLAIASNAKRVLASLWNVPDEKMLDVKVTGHQWWWEFDYLDEGLKVESRFTPKEKAGDLYLRDVDNRLVLPTHTPIRFLHTSADVLHAFWVPELGFKKDAIPGYVTETWATIEREGVFRGQCAELCGTWHARMPLVVEAVSPERFDAWLTERKAQIAALSAQDSADRQWAREELVARGEAEYNTYCAACHQPGGEGMPPAFPALKGSAIVKGPFEEHLKRVLLGVPGTAMQSFAHLSDAQIASIVTYERAVFNEMEETVQPATVRAAR
jgi:cytochrome c oxidase subunit 2